MCNKFLKISSKLLIQQKRGFSGVKDKVPLVIGGSILDVNYSIIEGNLKLNGATYKSKISFSSGGVARNIAENLFKIHGNVQLMSAFGDDQNGLTLKSKFSKECIKSSITVPDHVSASCAVILDPLGDSKLSVGDMSIHSKISPDLILRHQELFQDTPIVIMDANLSMEAIETILKLAKKFKKPVFFEPTDMNIAGKPFEMTPDLYDQIKFISPNVNELLAIAKTLKLKYSEELESTKSKELIFKEISELCLEVHNHTDNIIITMGELGAIISRNRNANQNFFNKALHYKSAKEKSLNPCRYYPVLKQENIVNASGAGDAFCSGFVAAMLRGLPENICVSVGFQSSKEALGAKGAVPKKYFNEDHKCWKTAAEFDTIEI